jgi:hypothetical protein
VAKKPKPKRMKRVKRGRPAGRLVITGDPKEALARFLKSGKKRPN